MWPLIFCQHTIHQVIWPNPGPVTLETTYSWRKSEKVEKIKKQIRKMSMENRLALAASRQ